MKRSLLLILGLLTASFARADAQVVDSLLYRQSCEGGDAHACVTLGLMYETGEGLARDPARAIQLYQQACDLREMSGCNNLGSMYEGGSGIEANVARALTLYERACNGGLMLSCENLGLMYQNGVGVLTDMARAAGLYQRACDGGLMTGCTRLGGLVQAGAGVPPDAEEAVNLYQEACNGGDSGGCVNLAVSLERGEGIDQDIGRAVELYQEACDANVMVGCVNLGSLYRTGRGVPQDARGAVAMYRRACNAGEPTGCLNLGISYELGDGVPADRVTAVSFYQRACDGGDARGCARLPTPVQLDDDFDETAVFTMRGRIADADTELPLAQAILDIPSLGIRAISDNSGNIVLENVPRGRYVVSTEAVGHIRLEGDLVVPRGEFLVLLPKDLVADPEASGQIIGRVTELDETSGISNVEVTVVSLSGRRTVSNPQGRFRLERLEPGLTEIQFKRLGYETRMSRVIVQPGKTLEVTARMSTEPIPLEPIQVVAVRSQQLEQVGFYERDESGWGHHFTADQIMATEPRGLADVVRFAPGAIVEGGRNVGQPAVVYSRRMSGGDICPLDVYVDGIRVYDDYYDINQIPTEQVQGMEIYVGVETPARFVRQSSGRGCGVVLVWIKRGA